MKTAKLDYPVHTLDNRLLLQAGKRGDSQVEKGKSLS